MKEHIITYGKPSPFHDGDRADCSCGARWGTVSDPIKKETLKKIVEEHLEEVKEKVPLPTIKVKLDGEKY